MPTLHIEHEITDLPLWSAAFERFADARARAGVRAQRVQHPVGDEHHLVIDLDFDTVDQARRFLDFLRANVWSSQDSAPALVGAPRATILQTAAGVPEVAAGLVRSSEG